MPVAATMQVFRLAHTGTTEKPLPHCTVLTFPAKCLIPNIFLASTSRLSWRPVEAFGRELVADIDFTPRPLRLPNKAKQAGRGGGDSRSQACMWSKYILCNHGKGSLECGSSSTAVSPSHHCCHYLPVICCSLAYCIYNKTNIDPNPIPSICIDQKNTKSAMLPAVYKERVCSKMRISTCCANTDIIAHHNIVRQLPPDPPPETPTQQPRTIIVAHISQTPLFLDFFA